MQTHSPEILEKFYRFLQTEENLSTPSEDKYLSNFRDEYIKSIDVTHSVSTVRNAKLSFNQLLSFIGDIKLYSIDSRLVDKFISETFQRSKHSAALYYRTLKSAFNRAEIWGYIKHNPFTKIRLPKFQVNEIVFPTDEELSLILVAEDNQLFRDIYLFQATTGCRISETLNLKLKSVNLIQNSITIGNKDFTTKGKKIRIIPLNKTALKIVENYLPNKIKNTNRVLFCKSNGFRYQVNSISKKFKKAVRKAGVRDEIRLHSLRHYAASKMISNGADISIVKDICGHKDIQTTIKYLHNDFNTMQSAIDKINFNID